MFPMPPKIGGKRQIDKNGQRQMFFKATGNCHKCDFWKPMNSKTEGTRIPGGFGKCARSRGHCDPEKPALGIDRVKATWQPKSEAGKKWGRHDLGFNTIHYRLYIGGEESPYFIAKSRYTGEQMCLYCIYGSGMSERGFALLLGGADKLEDAKRKAEKIYAGGNDGLERDES